MAPNYCPLMLLAVLALLASPGAVLAQPGFGGGGGIPGIPQNLDPALLRQALNQYPGTTPACVDSFVEQMTACDTYFGDIQSRFPDLERAQPQVVIDFVLANPPASPCCRAISAYNGQRCICESGTLPLARQFPARYWGLLEAGRCPDFQGAIIKPDDC